MTKTSPLALNAEQPICDDARTAACSQRRESRDPDWRDHSNPSETQMAVQQALRTLRAIRLRYEIDRSNSDTRLRSVLVALSCADMQWITAAVEALEKAIASEPAAER